MIDVYALRKRATALFYLGSVEITGIKYIDEGLMFYCNKFRKKMTGGSVAP
jgi:hypothetical protein